MSKVSRSVFQKVCEENKHLKRDLEIICCGNATDSIVLKIQYRDKFQKEARFQKELQEAILELVKENPEKYKTF